MKTYKMYVNNEFVGTAGSREIISPATGEVLATVSEAGKKDVDKAVTTVRSFTPTTWNGR